VETARDSPAACYREHPVAPRLGDLQHLAIDARRVSMHRRYKARRINVAPNVEASTKR
jgi:hypothetical protein